MTFEQITENEKLWAVRYDDCLDNVLDSILDNGTMWYGFEISSRQTLRILHLISRLRM